MIVRLLVAIYWQALLVVIRFWHEQAVRHAAEARSLELASRFKMCCTRYPSACDFRDLQNTSIDVLIFSVGVGIALSDVQDAMTTESERFAHIFLLVQQLCIQLPSAAENHLTVT